MGKECPEVREDLGAFMDEELDAQRHGWIEEHLKVCPPCQRFLKMIVGVKDRVKKSQATPTAPSHLKAKVLQTLDEEVSSSGAGWSWSRFWVWAPAPVLALALVLALIFSGSPPTDPDIHNFAQVSLLAMNRLDRGELKLAQPDSETYRQGLKQSGLEGMPMPSLKSMNYKPRGCCFGLRIDKPVAHYLFENSSGENISIIMWKADPAEDKILGSTQQYQGRSYFTAEQKGITLVMWADGDVYCSIAGRHRVQRLLQLASVARS